MSDASGSGGRSPGAGAGQHQPERYRRPLGGLWWAALILVPFTMGLTAWFVLGPKDAGDAMTPKPSASAPASSTAPATSTEPTSEEPSEEASTTEAAAADGSFCLKRTGNAVTLCGVVADEAAKQAAEDTVKAKLPGVTIDNQMTVAAGGAKVDTAQLGAYLDATKDSTDASLDYRDNMVTLTGTVTDAAKGTAAVAAAKALFPGAQVTSNLTAAKPSATPSAKPTANACNPATVNAALAKIGRIQFAAGDAKLTAQAKAQIAQDAAAIKACGNLTIDVKGFTDNTGPWAKNLTLSQQRADAVKAELVAQGVPAAKIRANGHGWRYPVVPNTSAANKLLNHRAEVSVR